MTRWLWIWFLAILAFPVASPSRMHLAPAAAGPAPAAAPRWGGPLAGVIDRLDWVDGRRVTGADLKGHVVLVEYWTFACGNCRASLPAMRALDRRFRRSDVRLISIHTPELPIERDPARVSEAMRRDAIEYPVALDPAHLAWDAIGNRYWPCLYVLDRDGGVRYTHVGELHEHTAAWSELLARVEALRGPHF